MPGYHGTKMAYQPEFHLMNDPRMREMLYARHHQNGKGAHHNMSGGPMAHPMFEALRARHAHEKAEYARMLKARDGRRIGFDGGYPTFDSLKLLGADNDANYLDAFMSEGNKHGHTSDDSDIKPRGRSSSHASKASSKRNSVDVENIKKTLIGSLRSTASDENIYESVEVIQYRKTIEAIKRQNKVRSVAKTGHPLFDHLRVENVLKPRRQQNSLPPQQEKPQRHRHREPQNSDGNTTHSSSGSGDDEFDYVKKPNCRFSRREVVVGSQKPKQQTRNSHHDRQTVDTGSESDDDWAIPRPKICGGGRSRRTGADGLMTSATHDESDSSSKSTGLR